MGINTCRIPHTTLLIVCEFYYRQVHCSVLLPDFYINVFLYIWTFLFVTQKKQLNMFVVFFVTLATCSGVLGQFQFGLGTTAPPGGKSFDPSKWSFMHCFIAIVNGCPYDIRFSHKKDWKSHYRYHGSVRNRLRRRLQFYLIFFSWPTIMRIFLD